MERSRGLLNCIFRTLPLVSRITMDFYQPWHVLSHPIGFFKDVSAKLTRLFTAIRKQTVFHSCFTSKIERGCRAPLRFPHRFPLWMSNSWHLFSTKKDIWTRKDDVFLLLSFFYFYSSVKKVHPSDRRDFTKCVFDLRHVSTNDSYFSDQKRRKNPDLISIYSFISSFFFFVSEFCLKYV